MNTTETKLNGNIYQEPDDGRINHLVPIHSITNHFVGLSQNTPIAIYSFPFEPDREASPVDNECAERQTGITSRYLANLDVPPHNHEFYEITMIREGHAVHHTDWSEVEVETGSIIVVPPKMVHAFTELQGLVVTNIYYQSEWLSENLALLLKQDGLVPLFLAADLYDHPSIKRIFHFQLDKQVLDTCVHEIRDICINLQKPSSHTLYVNACFLKMLILLSQAYCMLQDSITTLPFRPETWAVLEEMEDALLSGREFTFSNIAEKLNLSTRHLSVVFLRDVGLRPSCYFQRRRGHHAARLLLLPNNSVTQVAYTLGYTDCSHFCNQFKQLYGLSPVAYQKRFTRQR